MDIFMSFMVKNKPPKSAIKQCSRKENQGQTTDLANPEQHDRRQAKPVNDRHHGVHMTQLKFDCNPGGPPD